MWESLFHYDLENTDAENLIFKTRKVIILRTQCSCINIRWYWNSSKVLYVWIRQQFQFLLSYTYRWCGWCLCKSIIIFVNHCIHGILLLTRVASIKICNWNTSQINKAIFFFKFNFLNYSTLLTLKIFISFQSRLNQS